MTRPFAPNLSSSAVLEALGLERRHSRGVDVAFALGLALGGALIGALVVTLRAGVASLAPTPPEAGA